LRHGKSCAILVCGIHHYSKGAIMHKRVLYVEETGWQTAVQEHPDLILMDLRLPNGISGFDLTRRLKANPQLKQIPVIALTAVDTAEELALAAGCDGFLRKPADIRQIRATIHEHLGTFTPELVSEKVLSSFVAAY
jgi:CheY-like chemotaxis protein